MSPSDSAFPHHHKSDSSTGGTTKHSGAPGMSLRDYFAAKAMQGMLTDIPKTCYGPNWQQNVAITAFSLADEMLKARGGAS